MSIDRLVFAIGGTFILASVAPTQYHDPNWLWFTVFVGFNMLQAGFTRFCPLAIILKKIFGAKPGAAF